MDDTVTAATQTDRIVANLGFSELDFTGADQIEALKKLYYEQLASEQVTEMMVSHNRGTLERNLAISNSIQRILSDDLEKHFPNHRFFVGHFIVKEAGTSNSFQLHKDWNIVDESKFSSYQVWLPLGLSYPENGGMFFIPRSQSFGPAFRSGSFGIPNVKIAPQVYPFLSYTRLLPGQAVAFSNSVLHGSFSNATPENRLVVLVNLVEKEAQTTYYHFNKEKAQAETYPITALELLEFLPQLELGHNPFKHQPNECFPVSGPSNSEISLQQIISWVKEDRMEMNLPADYEFKQNNIFRDPAIERLMNHNGYVVIPFLTETEIVQLQQGFNSFFPDRSGFSGRYSSFDDMDGKTRKEAHRYIQKVISERLDAFFKDYCCPISVFYSKRADGVHDTDWHADPSMILNPQLDAAYRIWCPLLSIDAINGVLNVVPGSHRVMRKLTSPNFKSFSYVSEKRDFLNKYRQGFSLAAGEAIVFDARLIHSSPPNYSDKERDCIAMNVTPLNLKYINFTPTENKNVFNLYSQSAEYFFTNVLVDHATNFEVGDLIGPYYFFDDENWEKDFEAQISNFKAI